MDSNRTTRSPSEAHWRLRGLVTVILLSMGTTGVHARDLSRQAYPVGEKAAGMGGAFTAAVGDPASAYYNPAGLGGLPDQGISLSASIYQLALEDYRRVIDLDVGTGDRLRAGMQSQTFGTFPSSVSYVLPLQAEGDPGGVRHVFALSLVVPDYDKFRGVIAEPREDYAFELKGTSHREEVTYWAGPSYAVALGRGLRLGVSAFVLTHVAEDRANVGIKLAVDDGAGGVLSSYLTVSDERRAIGVTMLVQVGAQVDVSDAWTLGLSLRTPSLGRLYSEVHQLLFSSRLLEDDQGPSELAPAYVDRIETRRVKFNPRRPLMLALGACYRLPPTLELAMDLSMHLPQAPFRLYSGRKVYPTDARGDPILDEDRALDPTELRKSTLVLNANLGAEVRLADGLVGRLGLFTDFSAVAQSFYDTPERRPGALDLPRLQRVGASLGFGLIGERTTTTAGLVYVFGRGTTFGLDELFSEPPARIDVVSHTLTLVLAGSTDL